MFSIVKRSYLFTDIPPAPFSVLSCCSNKWLKILYLIMTLLTKCGIDSIQISSLKSMAVEIYKILNDMSPEYLSLFSKSSIPYPLRDNNKLIQQKMRTTTFGIKSFSYYGAHLWNSLPVDIKNAVTLGNFKTLVKNWQGPSCHCSVCQLIIWIRIFTVVVLISITVFMLFFSILSISRGYLTPKIRNTPTMGEVWDAFWGFIVWL